MKTCSVADDARCLIGNCRNRHDCHGGHRRARFVIGWSRPAGELKVVNRASTTDSERFNPDFANNVEL